MWDGNVAGMRESKNQKDVSPTAFDYMDTEYYFQDELGSPIRLINKEGRQKRMVMMNLDRICMEIRGKYSLLDIQGIRATSWQEHILHRQGSIRLRWGDLSEGILLKDLQRHRIR